MTDLASPSVPTSPDWGWQVHAACRGLGDEIFYACDNERGTSKRRREDAAKAICARCAVVDPCLAWALRAGEPHGVWGGHTVEERSLLQSAG